MFVDLLSVPTPTVIKKPPSNVIQEAIFPRIRRPQITNFFLDHQLSFLIRCPPTINELRVEVRTNNLGKIQYFSPFDRTVIVLDQRPSNNKQINIRLPYYS